MGWWLIPKGNTLAFGINGLLSGRRSGPRCLPIKGKCSRICKFIPDICSLHNPASKKHGKQPTEHHQIIRGQMITKIEDAASEDLYIRQHPERQGEETLPHSRSYGLRAQFTEIRFQEIINSTLGPRQQTGENRNFSIPDLIPPITIKAQSSRKIVWKSSGA